MPTRREINLETGEEKIIELTEREVRDAEKRSVKEAADQAKDREDKKNLDNAEDIIKAVAFALGAEIGLSKQKIKQIVRTALNSL